MFMFTEDLLIVNKGMAFMLTKVLMYKLLNSPNPIIILYHNVYHCFNTVLIECTLVVSCYQCVFN